MKRLWIVALVFAQAAAAYAVTPVIWQQNTQEAFSQGEAVGVSVTRDGEVRLGPSLEAFADTGEEFVWSVATGGGDVVYAGTGSEGRVYRLSAGNAELVFDSPERAIFALHVAANGTVYAGSSPGGLIYAIPAKGEPRTFARTEDQHVWALIDDGQGGLFAATGGQTGRVLRVSKSGEVSEVLATSDPNVTSLVRAADGTLYAGTDQNGLVYRAGASGTSDVLYDAAENEIKALAIAQDGRVLAGAMKSSGPSPQRGGSGGANARKTNGKPSGGQSVVYSIRPSGSGWRLWDVPAPSVQALVPRSDGSTTVVTGGKGRVFRLFPDGSVSVVTTVDGAQPWAFAPDGKGGGWISASGSGEVSRLGHTLSREGTLTSEPEDFSLITKWGRIRWDGEAPDGTGVTFDVRSGNSEVPDETWTDWSAAGETIGVREARYIQYRATLKGDGKSTPSIREVRVSGLPENVQPMVLELAVRGPHEEKKNAGGNGHGRRSGPPGEEVDGWEITWTGADVNNDPLIYALDYKGRSEKTWKSLAKELTGNSYVWDTESAPEGDVLIRLTVSDSPTNPPSLARQSERISAPFRIDHTEPVVQIENVTARAGGVVVTGTIKDATSFVKSAAYSVNSGDWTVLFPADQVFDSGEESLDLTISGLSAGEYTVVIRATDSRGNVGVAKHVFDVK